MYLSIMIENATDYHSGHIAICIGGTCLGHID